MLGGGQDEVRLFLNYPTDVSRMWSGPFLGVSFFVKPVNCFSFDMMYSYHVAHIFRNIELHREWIWVCGWSPYF